jgi:hypothetical protein
MKLAERLEIQKMQVRVTLHCLRPAGFFWQHATRPLDARIGDVPSFVAFFEDEARDALEREHEGAEQEGVDASAPVLRHPVVEHLYEHVVDFHASRVERRFETLCLAE